MQLQRNLQFSYGVCCAYMCVFIVFSDSSEWCEHTCNGMRCHDFTDKWYHLVQNKQSAIIAQNTIKINITRYHWISIYLNVSNFTRILCMFARSVISFWFKQHQAVNFIQIFYSHLLPSIQNTIVFICCSCYRSTRVVFILFFDKCMCECNPIGTIDGFNIGIYLFDFCGSFYACWCSDWFLCFWSTLFSFKAFMNTHKTIAVLTYRWNNISDFKLIFVSFYVLIIMRVNINLKYATTFSQFFCCILKPIIFLLLILRHYLILLTHTHIHKLT